MRWPRELIIGIGIGLIIAASFALLGDGISSAEIERQARALGMVYREETLSGGPVYELLLVQPTLLADVATALSEGGVIADRQALLTAAATAKLTEVAPGRYRFAGTQTADLVLTRLQGGEGK